MSTAGGEPEPPPGDRPDPDPGPSRERVGTTQRFVLLIVLFLTSSAFMMTVLFQPFTHEMAGQSDCQLAAGIDPDVMNTSSILRTAGAAYSKCIEEHAGGWVAVWLPYFATGLLLVLALVLYVLQPLWINRPSRTIPLAKADRGDTVKEALAVLAGKCELPRQPCYVVDVSGRGANALVNGWAGHYTVRLDIGLLTLFRTEHGRPAFEATLLHEFSHISNRDVDITYLTVALWRIFLLFVLIPFTAIEGWQLAHGTFDNSNDPFWQGNQPILVSQLILAAAMVGLTYLATAEILRVRETCADIDAVDRKARKGYWRQQAEAESATRRDGGRRAVARRARSLLRTHPDWAARAAALEDPRALVTARALPMFLAGAATSLFGSFIQATVGDSSYAVHYGWLEDCDIWPMAALAVAITGHALWRNVTAGIREGARPPSGLRAGAWLGVGLLAGELLTSEQQGNAWLPGYPEICLLLLIVLVPTAVMWWVAGCAALWADLPNGWRSRSAAGLTLAVGVTALAWWFEWWQEVGAFYTKGNVFPTATVYAELFPGYSHTTTMTVIATLSNPFTLITISWWCVWVACGLWIIPVWGLGRRRHRLGHGRVDGRPRTPRTTRLLARFRELRPGAVGALLGGAAVALALLVLAVRAHEWMRGSSIPQEVTDIDWGWVFAVLVCCAVAASVVTALLSGGNAAVSIAAAASTTAVGFLVLLATTETDGCVPLLGTVNASCAFATSADWSQITFLAMYGTLPTAVGALVVGAVAAAVAMPRSTPGPRVDDPLPVGSAARPGRRARLIRISGAVGICVVLVATTAVAYAYGVSSGGGTSGNGMPQPADTVATSAASGAGTSRRLLAMELVYWNKFGGFDLMGQYIADLNALDASVNGDTVDAAAMRRACTALITFATRAEAYFPLPDSQEPLWSADLADTIRGAQACLSGLDQSNSQLLASGLATLDTSSGSMSGITARMDAETKA